MFNGKIHYKWLLSISYVSLPEGNTWERSKIGHCLASHRKSAFFSNMGTPSKKGGARQCIPLFTWLGEPFDLMILIGVSWEIIELFMALNEGNPTCWLYDITRITASRWPCVFLIHGMLSTICRWYWMCSCQLDFVLFLCQGSQRLIYRQQSEKSHFAFTKPPFLCFLHNPQLIGFHNCSAVFCSQQHFKFFQESFMIWILEAWSPTHTHSIASTSCASSHPTPPPLQNTKAV